MAAVSGGFILASLLLRVGSDRRDHLLLPLVSALCGLGIIALWRIDPILGSKQVLWMMLGLALMLGTYFAVDDERDLARHKYLAGIGALALLIVTMVFGIEKNGARLWLGVPGIFVFQPTEVAKILMCIFLAGYVAAKGEMIQTQVRQAGRFTLPALKYMGPLLLVVVFFLATFVVQHDFGAAVLFFGLFVAISYVATGRKTYPLLAGLLFLGGMAAAYYASPANSTIHIRFEAWTNPWADPDGRGYQILHGLFALGSGGLSGQGLGRGYPELIPEAATDMIFPVVGEEMGLLGALALLLVYVLVAIRSFTIGLRSRHQFGMLLATCLAVVFALQTLIIAGGTLRLIPLTGITMPFVSYGGTSVAINFIALGLLLAISREEADRG
ncbi:FtsW/RodA/SpoVE family cell cycle protein [bacterium]|nr:FtsW/RodA/SpoVE family cell cycle protein [bacterium]